MSALGHLIAADARRHRLMLAAWLVIVLATTIVDGARPILSAGGQERTVGILGSLVSLTQFLLMLVLVPMVVQTHPLVGSDAFWMTRPIPPHTLLVSKMALLSVATVVVPTLAEAVLMAAYAVPLTQNAAVAAQTALDNTFWMILLTAAAALTPNLTRFALLCGGALMALVVSLATFLAISMAGLDDLPPMSGGDESGEPTSRFVLTVLAIVAGVALLVVQYRTRSRVRSVPVGAAGLFLALGVASTWAWPLLAPRLRLPSWVAADSALRLAASAESVQVTEELSLLSQRQAWRLARARVFLAGIEPNWSADAGVRHATLEVDGGTTLVSAASGHLTAVPFEGSEERPIRRLLRQLLDVDRLVDSAAPRSESSVIFFLRDAQFRRITSATGRYSGRFQLRLKSHALEATLPLHRGATHQHGAYRFVVEGVERGSASVLIAARESDATSLFDRRPWSELSFYLRNRRAREAVAGSAHDVHQGSFLSGFLPFSTGGQTSGFSARSLLIRFPPGHGEEKESLAIDDEWLEGAELVVVRTTRHGSVERTLEIADFPLRAASTSTPASER